jgi:single-stranded-DNA-specific exonuclease
MIRKLTWVQRPRISNYGSCGDEFIDRLILSRNIDQNFLISSPDDFPPACGMFGGNAGKAAEIIIKCLSEGLPIGIIGDYDADGITSASILQMVMRDFQADMKVQSNFNILLPSRQEEGYGLNPRTLKSYVDMWESAGVQRPHLTLVADCGTSSNEEVEALKTWGCQQVVVIDHHIPDPKHFSSAADVMVNWRISGEQNMCAAGECFHVARAICEISGRDWRKYLTLAAIGTIADMVPIEGFNRILVKAGLANSWQCGSLGPSLLDEQKASGLFFQKDVAFGLAPKLNSIGRLDSPDLALELMLTKNFSRAKEIAKTMLDINKKRKVIQKEIETQAIEQAEKSGFENGLLLYDSRWAHGVCGIAANAVVEEFRCPVILMGEHNGEVKGSGRSLGTTSIKDIMDRVSHIFSRYGGHELACGANLKREFLERGPEEFDRACGEYYAKHGHPSNELLYDFEIEPGLISPDTGAKLLEKLHPYCEGSNPEPTFRISSLRVTDLTERDAPEGKDWKLTVIRGSKDGFEIPVGFKSWDGRRRGDWLDKDVDILFQFPQSVNEKDVECVDMVDIVERKKGD